MHPRSSRMLRAALLALVCAAPVEASITPAAKRVVTAYLEATGGKAAFHGERTLRVKGTIATMGMKGTFEAWSQAPNRILTSIHLGPIKVRGGFDGVTAWRTDLASRKVTLLDGKDLEAAKADAYFQNELWARDDQGGGKVTLGSKAFGEGGVQQALEVTPPVGEKRRLWFNQKTGQLVRMVSRRDQHEWSERLLDPRKSAGRIRALTTESGDPTAPMSFQRLHVDSAWANVPVDSGLFSPPSAPVSSLKWLREKGTAKLPFVYGAKHVWVRASINGGAEADFLLDTGASITAIDSGYAARLGLSPEGSLLVEGMGAAGSASFARVKSLRLAEDGDGVELKDFKVGILDLAPALEPMLWRKPAGLLGYDFISRFVLEIDYDRRQLTLRDPASFVYKGGGEAISIGLVGGIPTVPVELDGECAGEFLIDIGNSFNFNVHGSMVRHCRLFSTKRNEIEVEGAGFGGTFSATLCRLKSIQIGPYKWQEPIAALSLTTNGMAGSRDYAGNLGNGSLERFICTFDYERRKLYLEPGKRFGERDLFSPSGTMFARVGDRVLASGITRGSAAEAAGLKPMDEVTAIDGRPILRFTPDELDRLFVDEPQGSTHSITVVRSGVKSTLIITLSGAL